MGSKKFLKSFLIVHNTRGPHIFSKIFVLLGNHTILKIVLKAWIVFSHFKSHFFLILNIQKRTKLYLVLQGPPTHIDVFQTNIFSWFNDTVIQSQWFLGLWDREIWYKCFFFTSLTSHGLHDLRKKRYKDFEGMWAWGSYGYATPLSLRLKVADY